MKKVHFGNASDEGSKSGAWFLGDANWLTDDDVRKTKDVAIKFSKHPIPNNSKNDNAPISEGHTITILIKGKFKVTVEDKPYILKRPGDYLIWDEGISHSWECLEADTRMITMRWPSPPLNQTA
jgi:hypothetical protein